MDKNQKKKIKEKILEIKRYIKTFDPLSVDLNEIEIPFKSYGNNLITGLNNVISFDRAIDEIWMYNDNIYLNYTRNRIINDILDILENEDNIEFEKVNNWLDSLLNEDIKDYWIYKEIKGAKLSKGKHVYLGPYLIVDRQYHKDIIVSNSNYKRDNWESIWRNSSQSLMIGVNIKVKDLDRGYEVANEQFRLFENIVKYLIPDFTKGRELTVVNATEPIIDSSYALISEGNYKSVKFVDRTIEFIDLNNPNFYNSEIGTDYLFTIAGKKDRTDIENRIIASVEWVGKGLREFDKTKAFIQVMFALEALLNSKQKEIIEPSVLSKMSENIAFTIGRDGEERLNLDKEFKYLYNIRSDIAHGRDCKMSDGDFTLLISMTKRIISAFLKNKELRVCITYKDYTDLIKLRKYE
jgi:hypothetical protein